MTVCFTEYLHVAPSCWVCGLLHWDLLLPGLQVVAREYLQKEWYYRLVTLPRILHTLCCVDPAKYKAAKKLKTHSAKNNFFHDGGLV